MYSGRPHTFGFATSGRMRSVDRFSLVGVGSLIAALGCASSESDGYGSRSQALLTEPVLSEVVFNPPSTDNPYEYVELRGPAGLALAGYSVAYIEGDAGTNLGKALVIWPLTGAIGSNGLFIIRAATGHAGVPPETGVQVDPLLATSGLLQNGSGTVILVKGTALVVDASYNQGGTLSLPAGATLLDAVSVSDGGATDVAFGPLVQSVSGSVHAVSRFADDDASSAQAAWYGGGLLGPLSSDVGYSSTACTAVMPPGAVLTPGAPNAPRPLVVDGGASGDGGVSGDASDATSVQDASTSTDAADAGQAEDASASTDASDSGSVQDATTSTDAGDAAPSDGGATPGDAASDGGAGTVDASGPPTAGDPVLNEVLLNASGEDGPYEYIELKGVPGAGVGGFAIVYIDGDSSQVGVAKRVFSLGSVSLGASGFLVLKAPTGGHPLPPTTTLVGNAAFTPVAGALENDTGTFLLVRGGTFVQSTDYDADDDGVLELPAGAVVVDAIAVTNGSTGAVTHASLLTLPVSSTSRAMSRVVGTSARSDASAWYGGALTAPNSSLGYDPAKVSANTPAGAALTPGDENAQGAPAPTDAGASVDASVSDSGVAPADAGPDAGPPPADAGWDARPPAVDAGRDAGPPPADAGPPPVDASPDGGAPRTDAGSPRDAGATQSFGEGEGSSCSCAVVGQSRGGHTAFGWFAAAGLGFLAARRRRR